MRMSVFRLNEVMRRPIVSLPTVSWSDLARYSSVLLAMLGLSSGFMTYLVLGNLTPLTPSRQIVWTLLSINMFIITGLVLVLIGQAIRVRRRQRKGVAGARMHGRMIVLFSAVAALPAILVAVFAIVTMDRGLDYWFSARTKAIIDNTSAVANAYMADQRESLSNDMALMVNDLAAAQGLLQSNPARFEKFLKAQSGIRKMPQALIIRDSGDVLLAASPEETILTSLPPQEAFAAAADKTVILTAMESGQVMALRQLFAGENLYLYTTRILSPKVMQHLAESAAAARDYKSMEQRRFETQLTFAMIYVVLTLVILLSAIWLGLSLADRLVLPISRLIAAARRLGDGDLESRVPVGRMRGNDEINELATSFNEMAQRLGVQQSSLDERARFTETVLHGVSSGVIGIDENGVINHANESAAELYDAQPEHLIGQSLVDIMPEFAVLADQAQKQGGLATDQLTWRDAKSKGHMFQASAAVMAGVTGGVVITFDDITDLLTAQRNAAWSDIARRIAHEIKNPLTPIQLSAERLQAKYGGSIEGDKDIFKKCTETIIRQVEDIGRMVDEFASFARMPTAVMGEVDLYDVVAQAVLLQRVAHRDIAFTVHCAPGLSLQGDRRLISQAITNLLKNAAEAVHAQQGDKRIELSVETIEKSLTIAVHDSGIGWPESNRYALLEPYHTSRPEGTGLGLSIVKKVVEDHGGKLVLADAPWCASGGTGASVQMVFPLSQNQTVGQSKMLEDL